MINFNELSYIIYLPITLFITIWIGKELHKNGRPLMQKAFKQSIRKKDLPLVIIRSITDLCATILFLTALFNMPLANASASRHAPDPRHATASLPQAVFAVDSI